MIYYITSLHNSDLNTLDLMTSASRHLFLAVNPNGNPDASARISNPSDYNMFSIFGSGSNLTMLVNSQEKIQVADKTYISDFFNMFSITEAEKDTKLNSITQGDIIVFNDITPSNIVTSSYQDLIDEGIIETDGVE
jgi:hypothetical protein